MEPEDYPDKRDALIGEFQNYLGILKVLPPHHMADPIDCTRSPVLLLCGSVVSEQEAPAIRCGCCRPCTQAYGARITWLTH